MKQKDVISHMKGNQNLIVQLVIDRLMGRSVKLSQESEIDEVIKKVNTLPGVQYSWSYFSSRKEKYYDTCITIDSKVKYEASNGKRHTADLKVLADFCKDYYLSCELNSVLADTQ